MPPGPTAPCSLAGLLAEFRPCFTAPTFQTFIGLVVGLIAQTRRRTVCGMLTGAGLDQVWHHSRAHRMFANARWSGDALGLVLADLIVARLLPADTVLTLAVDDTLFKRSGKKVFGAAWHHDGAAKGPKPIGFGNCWVVIGIVVQLPFLSRPVCLPVLARLWRPVPADLGGAPCVGGGGERGDIGRDAQPGAAGAWPPGASGARWR